MHFPYGRRLWETQRRLLWRYSGAPWPSRRHCSCLITCALAMHIICIFVLCVCLISCALANAFFLICVAHAVARSRVGAGARGACRIHGCIV